MTDFATPIELPRRFRALPHRRHRGLTGAAGVALAAAAFLPQAHLHHVWIPHVFGLVFAMFAVTTRTRIVGVASTILRALGWAVLAVGAAKFAHASPTGAVELVLGVFLVGAMGRGASEPRMASTAVLVGAVSTAWFALLAIMPEALPGTYVGLAGALGLFGGGLWWLVELAWQPDTRLPSAILRRAS